MPLRTTLEVVSVFLVAIVAYVVGGMFTRNTAVYDFATPPPPPHLDVVTLSFRKYRADNSETKHFKTVRECHVARDALQKSNDGATVYCSVNRTGWQLLDYANTGRGSDDEPEYKDTNKMTPY
jgi:hypothetical protein